MIPRALPAVVVAVAAIAASTFGEARAQAPDARFERNPIRADETVRLIVEADAGAGGAQPDVEPLRRDFEVLGQSSSTQITIGNGRRNVRTRWTFELAPRRPGRLTAGPLRAGAMTIPALALEVLPAPAANDASSARDVFIETDVAPEVYVQSQLTYTIRIYRAVEFLEATLSDFAPEGAVTHRLGKDATYTRVIDGRRYRVIERRFAVFPQASGRLVLPAVRLDARIAEAGAASAMSRLFAEGRRVRLASQPAEVTVEPRPAAAATPWLPARAVTLAEEWPEDPPRLVAGEPVTWTLRLGATGLAGEQLPPLDLPELGPVRVYPDQPSIVTRAGRDAVHGERVQRIAMVPGAAGELKLPELRVQWWDVEADAPRTASIPARTLAVAAAPAPERRRGPRSPTCRRRMRPRQRRPIRSGGSGKASARPWPSRGWRRWGRCCAYGGGSAGAIPHHRGGRCRPRRRAMPPWHGAACWRPAAAPLRGRPATPCSTGPVRPGPSRLPATSPISWRGSAADRSTGSRSPRRSWISITRYGRLKTPVGPEGRWPPGSPARSDRRRHGGAALRRADCRHCIRRDATGEPLKHPLIFALAIKGFRRDILPGLSDFGSP